MTAKVIDLAVHKRHLGMIATSESWRCFFLEWRYRFAVPASLLIRIKCF